MNLPMEPKLIGVSPNIQRIKELINQVADTGLNIVVCGETGVGKNLVVSAIQQQSLRSEGPLITINCGALTESLLESELFGHERGAFTGEDTVATALAG